MLLFGEEYASAATALVVLTFATLIQSFVGVGAPTLNMMGQPKANLWNYSIAVVLNIILNVVWIPQYGILGAAYASFFSMMLLGILLSVRIWLLIKLHPFSWKLFKPITAGIFAFVVLSAVKPLLMPFQVAVMLGLALLITIFAFGFGLWLMRPDHDDREVAKALAIIAQTLRRKRTQHYQ
jgi:O-antigen/teichoic acid export membrane protein